MLSKLKREEVVSEKITPDDEKKSVLEISYRPEDKNTNLMQDYLVEKGFNKETIEGFRKAQGEFYGALNTEVGQLMKEALQKNPERKIISINVQYGGKNDTFEGVTHRDKEFKINFGKDKGQTKRMNTYSVTIKNSVTRISKSAIRQIADELQDDKE